MKFPFVILVLLIMPVFLFGQNRSATNDRDKKIPSHDSIKVRFNSYVIKYPREAQKKFIEGTVIISFDIDSTCSIRNRIIKQGLGYGCDEAALSILDKLERDIKKDYKSKCKPSSETLPVNFNLKE